MLHAEHRAAYVGREHRVEVLAGDLGDADHRRAGARVVHQAVEPTELRHRVGDHRPDARFVGDVGADEAQRRPAALPQRPTLLLPPAGTDQQAPAGSAAPTTRPPSAPKTSAMRSPIPLVAPVTMATFPSSWPTMSSRCRFVAPSDPSEAPQAPADARVL